MSTVRAHVIIPAHDEAAVIGETLRRLLDDVPAGTLETIVVANGCHDETAAVARIFPGVRVIEIAEPSKTVALAVGARAVSGLPRVHLDADCPISGRDVLRLVAALDEPGVLASGPSRELEAGAASSWVREFYRVWERLPGVRDGLYGRGVIALSEQAQRRIAQLPDVMSDDLAISEAFAAHERRIVTEARVAIRVPRTVHDLVRRRARVATGTHQVEELGLRRSGSGTSMRTLAGLVREEPGLLTRMPAFVLTAVLARTLARRAVRRGDYTTWLRDDSSRTMHPVLGGRR